MRNDYKLPSALHSYESIQRNLFVMSSHHFVREGQEPALLILDALAFDIAGPLLEWAPLVVVAQSAVDEVMLWNIKMDVVLAEEKMCES